MIKIKTWAVFTAVLGASIVLSSLKVEAVPAFARQVNAECTLCHTAFPKLNDFGSRFRANGYRLDGDKGKYIWDQPVSLGIVGQFSYKNSKQEAVSEEHNESSPSPVEETHRAVASERQSGEGENSTIDKEKLAKFGFDSLLIHSAGTLAPSVSYFAHLVSTKETTTMELAHVAWMDILPDSGLNLRAGKMAVDLPYLSSSRRFTYTDYLLQITQSGGHGGHGSAVVTTGATFVNEGVEAFGMFDAGEALIQYGVGLGNDNVEVSENNVGAYHGYATVTVKEQTVGFLYRYDRVGETEATQSKTAGYGVSGDFNFAGLNLVAAYHLLEVEVNGISNTKINSGTLEAFCPITEELYFLARYDFNNTQDSEAEQNQYVASLIYYLRPNVRLQLEYTEKKETNTNGVELDFNGFYTMATFGF